MNLAVRKISDKLDHKDSSKVSTVVVDTDQDEEIRNYTDEEFKAGYLNQRQLSKNEEIIDYTDEEFQAGYLNQKRLSKNEEIKEILKHKDIDF